MPSLELTHFLILDKRVIRHSNSLAQDLSLWDTVEVKWQLLLSDHQDNIT
jgi:hypothetical protein